MDEPTSLDDLLNDEPSTADPVAEAPPSPDDAQPRDEHGRFAPKGEEQSVSPAPVEETAFEGAATIGERKRRQQAETERDELRARLEALESRIAPKEQPAPPPSIWDDEEGALQHYQQRSVADATFNSRLDMSEMLASQAHDDFDAMKAKFMEMATVNPALAQQAIAARHPWEHAYQTARNASRFEEMGATDVADLEAKIREKVMAELQAQQPAARSVLPPTLTTERNVGSRAGPAWSGPASLDDLLR